MIFLGQKMHHKARCNREGGEGVHIYLLSYLVSEEQENCGHLTASHKWQGIGPGLITREGVLNREGEGCFIERGEVLNREGERCLIERGRGA